jgi:hypothetical protein
VACWEGRGLRVPKGWQPALAGVLTCSVQLLPLRRACLGENDFQRPVAYLHADLQCTRLDRRGAAPGDPQADRGRAAQLRSGGGSGHSGRRGGRVNP